MVHPAILPYYFILTINIATSRASFWVRRLRIYFVGSPVRTPCGWNTYGCKMEIRPGDRSSWRQTESLQHPVCLPAFDSSDEDGHLPPFSAEAARRFQKIIHRKSPQVRILPWVGGVRFSWQLILKRFI